MRLLHSLYVVLPLILISLSSLGLAQDSTQVDFSGFSLEELLDVEVVSISRQAEGIQGAAAAVFVISAEDIRRSGALSIPEVLRLAPGLNVARINANTWAVTSRGFNSRFANKLQVLVDGRSVYSPMFSGVYWEDSSVMMEDIERIEIIRGPGATMWGANAVNGVINIITVKPEHGKNTSFVGATVSTRNGFKGAGRVEGDLGDRGAWNLSAQYQNHGSSKMETGEDSFDEWDEQLVRVRLDQQLGTRDNITVTGHHFTGNMDNDYPNNTPYPPYSSTGRDTVDFLNSSFQTIWVREISQTSGMKLGLYFTHFEREETLLREINNIVDMDFQHNFLAGNNHALIWGASFRYFHDNIRGNPTISFIPGSNNDRVFSAFVQDDWSLITDRLKLTLGEKWEHRDYIGDQWQPNVRMSWTPSPRTTWWGAIARAVRVPSRINRHIQMDMTIMPPGAMFPGTPTTTLSMVGNQNMVPEELLAHEVGFRFKPNKTLSFDLALFLNEYDQLRILERGDLQPHPVHDPPTMMIPLIIGNGPGGRTQGGELAADWMPFKKAKLQLAYSNWNFKPADLDGASESGMESMSTPRHQISLRGLFCPGPGWEVDFWFRFTDDLLADPENVESWDELDLRLSWHPSQQLDLVLGGQNLLHENHQEFRYQGMASNHAWIQRSGYFGCKWAF